MTRTFLPLVQAQATARKVDPRVVVVEHPVGGLDDAELADRIDAAYTGVVRELDALGDR